MSRELYPLRRSIRRDEWSGRDLGETTSATRWNDRFLSYSPCNFTGLVLENQVAWAETKYTAMISVFETIYVPSFIKIRHFMLKEFPCQ